MSWYTLMHEVRDGRDGREFCSTPPTFRAERLPRHTRPTPAHAPAIAPACIAPDRRLGSALAGKHWSWAESAVVHVAPARRIDARDCGRVLLPSTETRRTEALPACAEAPSALQVRRSMAAAARLLGRSEEEVWLEAARDWLARRARDDDPPPSAPAAAHPVPPRRRQSWEAIDALLCDLRAPAPADPAA